MNFTKIFFYPKWGNFYRISFIQPKKVRVLKLQAPIREGILPFPKSKIQIQKTKIVLVQFLNHKNNVFIQNFRRLRF